MNLTELSLKRPVTISMVATCFVLIGILAGRLLPLEFMPDIDVPMIDVNLPYPGSSPEEVERLITRPAEEVLATISDIKRMTSNASEDGGNVRLEFEWGVETDIKAMEARDKLENIRGQFPADLERFFVRKFSITDMEILTLRLSSNRDLSNAYDLLNRNLKRRLERIEGISRCDLYGVEQKQIRIQLLPDRIIAYQIDIGRLVQALQRSNFLLTAGKITDGNKRFVLRPIGEFQSIEEIGEFIVKDDVRLRTIAQITYEQPERTYGRHLGGKYAIGLDIFKESGANTVEVADRVLEEIEKIGRLPEMEGINIFFLENQADAIVSSLEELLKSGMLGGLFAVVVLYFFLRRLSTTLIVALAVPCSLFITMAFMYFFGISLNILTLMGLMLAIGMLVDNAVVVTESIHRHQHGASRSEAAIVRGVMEVALAITAGTCTTMIVFLPNIVSPNDQISIYLKHVAITICIALSASLVLARTLVPLLASKVKPPRERKKNVIDRLIVRYSVALSWTLRHPAISLLLALLVLGSTAIPFLYVKLDMFNEPKDRRLRLFYHISGSYTLEKVEQAVDLYEEYLFAHQAEFEIEAVYSYFQGNFASSTILLTKDGKARKSMEEITDAIRAGLPRTAIANPSFDFQSAMSQGESIQVALTGASSERLAELSQEVAWTLEQIEGLADVRSSAEVGTEEVHVKIDRERARRYGFSPRSIADIVSASMRGVNLPRFRTDDGEVQMRLAFHESDTQTLEHLSRVPLFNGADEPVKLASLARFEVRRGPRNIYRENRVTSLAVGANLENITVTEAGERIRQALDNFDFPPGYTWHYGRSFDEEEDAFNTMMINLALALALIYFVMASLFESLIFPAAIWTQILFAVVGVYWFFLITGTLMTMMSLIGILILIGVVVNNGIVLIDYVNQLRSSGMPRNAALLQAGQDRLRPILMTAGTTVLSMIPLCLVTTQIGGDGPPYFPMARAIVGGLTFSTVVTLLILPTIYVLLDNLRQWARGVMRAASKPRIGQ